MIIQVPFDLGQPVWIISHKHVTVWRVCPACEGEGLVTLANGKRTCPDCYGRKGSWENRPHKWQVEREMTIGQVRLEITTPEYKDENEYRLMCIETGVGSGTLWDMRNAFASKEEAVAECERRNALPEFKLDGNPLFVQKGIAKA